MLSPPLSDGTLPAPSPSVVEGSANTFGDQQLSVDVIADELMWQSCKKSSVVAYGASEEEPEVKNMNEDKSKKDAEFTVWYVLHLPPCPCTYEICHCKPDHATIPFQLSLFRSDGTLLPSLSVAGTRSTARPLWTTIGPWEL